MAMTLQDVREAIALKLVRGRDAGQASLKEWHAALVEHIHGVSDPPAQAVDVGAIREVIDRLSSEANAHDDEGMPSTAAYLSRMAIKLTRAISAAPPSNSPTTGAIGENGNG